MNKYLHPEREEKQKERSESGKGKGHRGTRGKEKQAQMRTEIDKNSGAVERKHVERALPLNSKKHGLNFWQEM